MLADLADLDLLDTLGDAVAAGVAIDALEQRQAAGAVEEARHPFGDRSGVISASMNASSPSSVAWMSSGVETSISARYVLMIPGCRPDDRS